MAKISIVNTEKKFLESVYRHLSVQSLLDIKAVNGEVTKSVLPSMLESSSVSKTVFYDGKIAYSVFVMPTDVEECSVFVVSTTLGYSDVESLRNTFSAIIKDLPEKNLYSIVYKGNHKYSKLLKDNGFRFIRNLIHGEENRNFLLLGKKKDEQALTK
jgi:hypothetical protein